MAAYKKNTKLQLSELDKVGLNLVYLPCIDNVRYKPRRSRNGMYYCGRPVMSRHTYAGPNYTDVCGPDEGPNCPACRTIISTKVQMILAGERWQGMQHRRVDPIFLILIKVWSINSLSGLTEEPSAECSH